MKNFFFKTKWNIIFIFVPFILLMIGIITSIVIALAVYNHFDIIYSSEWKDKLLKRTQTFYIQIQQTIEKDKTPLPISYIEDTEDVRPTVSIPSVVYDRNGTKIGYYGTERRDYIALDKISENFLYTLLASEDRRFFSHFGIDLKRTIPVTLLYILFDDTSYGGGSSITQQLARYLMEWNEVSIERKVIEMLGAIDLERNYSKKQILEMYCNFVPFGHGAYGVENASQTFFGKSSSELTLGEAALLVGVIPSPVHFSPFQSDPEDLEVSKNRHKRVLYSLVDIGFMPELDTYEKADEVHKEFWNKYDFDSINRKATFSIRFEKEVAYIGEQIRRELIEESERFEKLLTEGGGLNIYTTIDLETHKKAQHILREELQLYRKDIKQNYMEELKENFAKWKRNVENLDKNAEVEITEENLNNAISKLQSALVLVNNQNGELISFVGGDGFNAENQFIRTHQSKRQTGSAFKPILYYSALDTRKVDMYTKYDGPSELVINYDDDKEWSVSNFGNFSYGRIPLVKALYKSVNTVAAVLIRDLGIAPIRNNIKKILDIKEDEALRRFPNRVPSLSLGTAEMTPLEMATVYSTFARLGKGVKPYLISKVYNHKGSLLIDNEKKVQRFNEKQILTKETVYILTKMMHKIFEDNWDNGGTAARIRKLTFVPEKINIDYFDKILNSFPTNEEDESEDKKFILDFYEKDEEENNYILKKDISEENKEEILKKIKTITYNDDLKGWYMGKTGTTQTNTNAWLCGANDKYTLIVWVGNDDNISLFRTGGEAAGTIWARIMLELEEKYISSSIESEEIKVFEYPLKTEKNENENKKESGEDEKEDEDSDNKKDIFNYAQYDMTEYDLINIPVSEKT
ncbi:MAG: transglycosylase domain-containing protein, partial [Spirochaetota bacterium]